MPAFHQYRHQLKELAPHRSLPSAGPQAKLSFPIPLLSQRETAKGPERWKKVYKLEGTHYPYSLDPPNQFFVFGMLVGVVCIVSICTCIFKPSRTETTNTNNARSASSNLNASASDGLSREFFRLEVSFTKKIVTKCTNQVKMLRMGNPSLQIWNPHLFNAQFLSLKTD